MLRRTFKAFQYRDFRLMWIGAWTSSVGTWMQAVAQGWLIYRLSNSPFLLALDAVLASVPIFLFSVLGGVIADRVERRYILIGSQYVQMACAFLLTALIATGTVEVWHILSCSFITGFAQAFGGPAYQALIPMLVDREDMPNAIALNSIQFNAAVMVGPAVSAGVLAALGETWCFALNGISFFAPIIALRMLRVRFAPVKTADTIFSSMKDGFRFIQKRSAMAALIALAFGMTFLSIPMRTFLPVFAKDIFGGGPEMFAVFLSISGMGSIAGALSVAGAGNLMRKGRVTLAMLLLLGASTAVFGTSRSIPVSCVALFLSGAAMMAGFALVSSLVQLIVTDEMRGRVMSVYSLAFRGGMTAGNIASGSLVEGFSAPLVISANGMLLVGLAIYFAFGQRRIAAL